MNHKESNLRERKAQIVYLWLRDSSQPTSVLNSFHMGQKEMKDCNHFLLLEESLIKRISKKKGSSQVLKICNLQIKYNERKESPLKTKINLSTIEVIF